ncbi:MAG: hypothetical protein IJY23_01975 [Clostridia bacterium]|nr:hypothetical protein [Clostridia bacterium]
MDIGAIFTIAFFAILALALLRGLFRGKKFVWQYTLTRMLVSILSAVIAVFVAVAVAKNLSATLYGMLEAEAFSDEIKATLSELESVPAVLQAVVSMILAPILFYPIRFVAKIILKIFAPLFRKLLMSLSDKTSEKKAAKAAAKATVSETNGESEKGDVSEETVASESGDEDFILKAVNVEEVSENAFEATPEEDGKKKKREKKPKKKAGYYASGKNPVGIAIGMAGALIGVIIFFAPIMGGLSVIGSIVGTVADAELDAIGDDVKPVIEIADSVTNSTAVKTNNMLGGKLIYDALTTYDIGSEKATLSKEVELLCAVADAALVIMDEEAGTEDSSQAVAKVSEAFDSSAILPSVISETISAAATAWSEGETFLGTELPGGDNELLGSILTDAVIVFKDSTPETVKEDFKTILDVLVVVVENDIIDNPPSDPMLMLENKKFISDLLYLFFENDRLSTLVGGLIDTGISMLTDTLGVPKSLDELHASMFSAIAATNACESEEALAIALDAVFAKHGIDLPEESAASLAAALNSSYGLTLEGATEDGIKSHLTAVSVNVNGEAKTLDLSNSDVFAANTLIMTSDVIVASHGNTVTDSRAEANALADIFASISTLSGLFSGEDNSIADMLTTLGESLDKFAATQLIGKECVDNLVTALLQSESVESALSMDPIQATAFAKSVIKGTNTKSYSVIMGDIANTIDVLSNVSSSETVDEESIKEAINTLTPETAGALKELVTPELVVELGVGEESKEGVSQVLSNVFDNIATAKDEGMSDEEFTAETEKISNVLNVTMSMSDGTASSEDIEFDNYVSNVMDSKILSSTIVDSVYGESDEPQMDPLNTGMEITEGQQETLVNTLQEKLDAADDESKEDTEKTVTAVAAYMNVKVEIIDGVVTIVPPEEN